jgi:outer membrane lipoprotein carrier protein
MSHLKTNTLIVLLLAFALHAGAQSMRRVTGQKAKQMIEAVNKAAARISSIEANFVQVKQMKLLNDRVTSRGKMWYTNRGQLRWEYTSPYSYIFVINGGQVQIKSGNRRQTIDVRQSQLFKSIASIMMSSVTGKSLKDSRDFTVQMYTQGNQWIALLKPRRGQMKKMFSYVRLHFNTQRNMVSQVVMKETSGDETVITLHDVRTNQRIGNETFTVR